MKKETIMRGQKTQFRGLKCLENLRDESSSGLVIGNLQLSLSLFVSVPAELFM